MAKRIHVRPGRGQSKVGFVVGILFCIFGLFVVIPIAGIVGIFWTALAGWITYANYKNGFTDEQIDSHVIDIEDDGQDVTMTRHGGFHTYSYNAKETGDDMEKRLRKLQSLYDQSLITYEEYEQKKKEILEEL